MLVIHKPTSKYIAIGKGHDYGRQRMVSDILKSDNRQYDMLVRWVAGMNDSSTISDPATHIEDCQIFGVVDPLFIEVGNTKFQVCLPF